MATVTLVINTDNAAFDGRDCGAEIARILHSKGGLFEGYSSDDISAFVERTIVDSNGTRCGYVRVVSE